jgi:ABC-type nitrate/sulfonate/bicarbonate transport system ATPase subunit
MVVLTVLDDINFSVYKNSFVSVIGPMVRENLHL